MAHGIPNDFNGPDLERVPTLAELERSGLAIVVSRNSKREPTHYQPTREGEAILRETMRLNAERGREWDRQRDAARS